MRVPALVSAHGLAVVALATLAACKVSVPDPTQGVFRCGSDHDCLSGYGCFHPEGQQAGELGYCTPGGQPVSPCGETFCREGEVCVRADGGGGLACRTGCTDDYTCSPTGLCAVVARADGALVGACGTCPDCPAGRSCAKHGESYDIAGALYCNAPGQDCWASGDTDGDGMSGCQDADCVGTSACPTCGNLAIDAGEACDGYVIGGDQSCPAGTYGALHCDGSCQLDARDCSYPQQSCGNGVLEGGEQCEYQDGNLLVVDGKIDCSAWIGGAMGQVGCTSGCQVDTGTCGGVTASCGNSFLDGGESCDGSAGIVDCAQLDSEYSATSSPGCSPYCYYDLSSCQPAGPVCGTCNYSDECVTTCLGTLECEPWITSAGLPFAKPPVTRAFQTAMAYRYGPVWVAWESTAGIDSATYWPSAGGTLSPAGPVNPAGVTARSPAIAFDEAMNPVAAYVAETSNGPRLYLSQWDGTLWRGLNGFPTDQGDGITAPGVGVLGSPVFATVPSGLWLAAIMDDGSVKLWFVSSTSYAEYSGPGVTGVSEIALTADETYNQPIVAWVQSGVLSVSRNWGTPEVLATDATSPSLSWDLDVAVAAWGSTSGQVFVETQSPGGPWMPLPGASYASVASGPSLGRVALVRHAGTPVVAWAENDATGLSRQNRVLAHEGELRGWRGFAATECAGASVDPNPFGNQQPAIAAGIDNSNRLACISYVALTAIDPELRVSCHHIP